MNETILAGRYRLVEQIGEGGMALVYRAIDQNTGHNVAIKVLKRELSQDSDYVIRFQREAEAASKMTHHNIVNLLDVGMDGSDRYLVMEYVKGITLKELIRQKERLAAPTAAQICIRILSALDHAHSHGIIHRDIKPQNILVANDGHVKVSDFGIARIANSYTLTRDDSVMGTVYYYSPQQASGQKVEATSDIYSTGIVLYEMLTGRVPFTGDTQVAIAMQHLKAKPVPIQQLAPDVSPAIAQVCMKAMAKLPANRYQSAKEMAEDLHLALAGRTEELKPSAQENTAYMPPAKKQETPQQPERRKTAPRPAPKKPVQKQKPSARRVIWWILSCVMAVLVCYGLWVGCSSIYEKVVNYTEVPDLMDLQVTAAEKAAIQKGLYLGFVYVNHPTAPAGTVVLQSPEAGTAWRKGEKVVVNVSTGPATLTVPKVTGSTLSEAYSKAKSAGLELVVVEYVASQTEDNVLTQIPAAGTQCLPGDKLQVTVSGGKCTVPSVVGTTPAAAKRTLQDAGLSSSIATTYVQTQDISRHGLVASQAPEAGTGVIRDTVVYLTLYRVPDLTRSSEVLLSLPERSDTISVRVVLVVDGVETAQHQLTVAPTDSRHPKVTLSAQIAGEYVYKVYINGDFAYQETTTLE